MIDKITFVVTSFHQNLVTGSLAHWLTGSLAHWLTGSLAHWLTSSLAYWLTGSLAHWLTGSLAVANLVNYTAFVAFLLEILVEKAWNQSVVSDWKYLSDKVNLYAICSHIENL